MGNIDVRARAIQSRLNNILWKSIESHPTPFDETSMVCNQYDWSIQFSNSWPSLSLESMHYPNSQLSTQDCVCVNLDMTRIIPNCLYTYIITTVFLFLYPMQDHSFFKRYDIAKVDVATWFATVMAKINSQSPSPKTSPGAAQLGPPTTWIGSAHHPQLHFYWEQLSDIHFKRQKNKQNNKNIYRKR